MKSESLKYIRTDIPNEFNEINIIKNNFERLKLDLQNNIVPPYEILIHVTSKCNLSCKWCIGRNLDNQYSIVENRLLENNNLMELVKSIADYKKTYVVDGKSKTFKVERVSFSGITGEPLMAGEVIINAIDYLTDRGIEVGMFTNGILINESNRDTILKMNYVLISLDAGTQKTYDELKMNGVQTNSFHKVIQNIKDLNAAKEKTNSSLDINVGYVINPFNYHELFTAADTLKKAGIHYLRFKTDISSKLNINSDLYSSINLQIERIKEDLEDDTFGIVLLHRIGVEEDKQRDFKKCYINRIMAAISSDGKMYACNYHPTIKGIVFGDVIDSSFSKIWEEADFDVDVCNKCPKVCDPFKNRANKLLNEVFSSDENKNKFVSLNMGLK